MNIKYKKWNCIPQFAFYGMLEALVSAGLVSGPLRVVELAYPTHKIEIPICKLLQKGGI